MKKELNKTPSGFQESPPHNSNPERWIKIQCKCCQKYGFVRKSLFDKRQKRGQNIFCGNSCSAKAKFNYFLIPKEQKNQIIKDCEAFGTIFAAEKHGISRYAAARISGWDHQKQRDFVSLRASQRKEERRGRKNEVTRKSREKNREKINKRSRDRRRKQFFKQCEQKYGPDMSSWDFWRIAKRQKMKCFYTGIKLNRQNISVEHIVPTSKGGENSAPNIVFVHVDVNRMKLNHSLDDFKNWIEILYKTMVLSPSGKTTEDAS